MVSVYTVAKKPQALINAINAKFHVDLVTPASDIYDRSLLHSQASDAHRSTLVSHYFPEALDIYQELNAREVQLDKTPDEAWLEKIKSAPDRVWAFQDWVNCRHLEKQVKSLQFELEQTQSQLQRTQVELESLSSKINTDSKES